VASPNPEDLLAGSFPPGPDGSLARFGEADLGKSRCGDFSFLNRLHSNAMRRMRALVFTMERFALSSSLRRGRHSRSV
jgi:hypothetical protein